MKTKTAKKPTAKFKSFIVTGKGDSLWCNPEDTKNIRFKVTKMRIENFADSDEPYELQLFGPRTEWFHYTDSRIEREVEKAMLPIVRALYPNSKIKSIGWSEQGMQPNGGWSFDIDCDYRKDTQESAFGTR
jgi:hypothetical protein